MTIANLSKLGKQVEQKMKRLDLSQNKAAKIIGCSNGTLSTLINQVYLKDQKKIPSSAMVRKIENWVYSSNSSGWNVAPTKNFKRVQNICAHAQSSHIARAICFSVGSGKTSALKNYASNNPNTYYIECEEHFTKKKFLQSVCLSMGESIPPLSSIADIVDIIVNRLNTDRDPLLIIDEADKLKDGVINFFKTFYNKTTDNAGFILCGAPHFKSRLEKGIRKQKQAYQEIHSRFGGEFLPLHKITADDVALICECNDIQNKEDVDYILDILVQKFGTNYDFRNVKYVIDQLKMKKSKAA